MQVWRGKVIAVGIGGHNAWQTRQQRLSLGVTPLSSVTQWLPNTVGHDEIILANEKHAFLNMS